MTYAQFLLIFLVPPIFILITVQARCIPAARFASVIVLAAIAFLYTPLWDHYLIENRIWTYDSDRVIGKTLGAVPLEECAFFLLQPILTGLWLIALHQRWPTSTRRLNKKIRLYSVLGVGIVWLASAIVRAAGTESATYLTLILVWALPPVMLQLAYGADMLWQRRELVLTVIATSTLYLAGADALAIYQGIWTIAPSTSLQINLLGVLPIEELVFFLITNVLVTFGVMLLIETTSHQRISRLQRGRLWNLVGGKKGIHT